MRKIILIANIFFFFIQSISKADEGMWLPLLIKRLNHQDMKKMGLKLTADEIYNVNNSSLKDAIVNFGNFCTGEIISKEGLLLTNHHCGYEAIQSHSTIENNYLLSGFWASSNAEEKTNVDLTASFLIRMEDVTNEVLSSINPQTKPAEINAKIDEIIKNLEKKSVEGTHYNAEVKSFFEGNEYYLFVYETFNDVRLVGAPPSAIGKFGGETDNWMWPRHTGDFSLFRVYTSPEGKPASYSPANIPYKPKHHIPISLKGVAKNDFTMVLGYPGSTERYLPSEGVKMLFEQSNPIKIKIREKRLLIIKEGMEADPETKIKYAAKYAQISNYYKYFIGQNQGLRKLQVIKKKQEGEKLFLQWVNNAQEHKDNYGNTLNNFQSIYQDYKKINPVMIYLEEAALGTEILLLAYKFNELYALLKNKGSKDDVIKAISTAKTNADIHFKNYNYDTDQRVLAAMLQMYFNDISPSLHPDIFHKIQSKYKGNFEKFSKNVFLKSIFSSQNKINDFINNPDIKTLEKDLAFQTIASIAHMFVSQIKPFLNDVNDRLEREQSIYTKGIMEMNKSFHPIYPNANFTMRLSYGSVQDYFPQDAVHYSYKTSLDGLIQKSDSTNEDFTMPSKLKLLYETKDFGDYTNQDGVVPICFITNNDITGGNSGSPVINATGELVGVAFDGNWEAMSGDILYEPKLQRCIVTDIRYILFVIDKFAGAKNLIDEMTLVD